LQLSNRDNLGKNKIGHNSLRVAPYYQG
jgi:hypothetical protein